MSEKITQIDPFTNIPFATLGGAVDSSSAQNASSASMYLSNVLELNVGQGGDLVFRADKQGIWLGASKFADAPFSVSMAGLLTLAQRLGSFTFTSQPTTPYHIGDLWTDGDDIKYCSTERLTGAFNAADWTLASNYENATGVTSIIGGVVDTDYVNALDITVLGTVTAGILSGVTIRTASTGERLEMTSGDASHFNFYYNSTLYGYLETDYVSASESHIKFVTVDGNGISMNTSIGASGYNDVIISANGGTIENSGNASSGVLGFFGGTGSIVLEHSGAGEWVSVDDIPMEINYKLKIPVGTNLY